MRNVFSMVLAGGEGRRLAPLTQDRAKPAVPFGGVYRLIDFPLSNLVNAGFTRIAVLTQYKSHSLDRHISKTWRLSTLLGEYVTPVPAQMRRGPRWFLGSADAIYQNLNLLRDERPDHVIVLGADNIYRLDPREVVRQHIESGAGVTVMGIRAPLELADQFGVIETDATDPTRISAFREKPKDAVGLPDEPDRVYASMGNYVFSTDALVEAVNRDAEDPDSNHDVGGNLIPWFVGQGAARVYDFSNHHVPGETERDHGYWRDVGSLDAYHAANMDLISVHPVFNLYNHQWPILTHRDPYPPAKFVFNLEGRRGMATDSMVSEGVIVSGGKVEYSVLSPRVRVHSYSHVSRSVLLHGVEVGRNAVIRNAIIDKDVLVMPGATIGVDLDRDRERFTVSDEGIVVVAKHTIVEA